MALAGNGLLEINTVFQNGDFYLVGYTLISGKLYEYQEEADFNLSTGKLIVKKNMNHAGSNRTYLQTGK